MSLVRENVTSLYDQIAGTLRGEIENGSFEPSGKLPSEAELSERFGVSRVTVRLAIGKLADEKLVERKQGKGTFASGKRMQHRLDVLRGFYDSLARQGTEPQMRLLRMQPGKKLPADMAGVFANEVKTAVYLERLHSVDGVSVRWRRRGCCRKRRRSPNSWRRRGLPTRSSNRCPDGRSPART